MSSLTRARRTVLAAAAIALPLSLLPLASASADPAPPQFVYEDVSSAPYARVLFSANADGSSPTSLLPAGYQVRSFDVTPDGQTELLGLCKGKPADCANRSTRDAWRFNTVYSLVLVHHDAGYGTKVRVLTSSWDTNVALTDDGRPVWMTDSALYRLNVDYSTADWATSTTPPVKSVAWAPPSGGFTDDLTVSGDGTAYAVIQENAAGTTFTVRAGSFDSPSTGPRLSVSYASTDARLPSGENFRFVDATHLAYSAYQPADGPEYSVGGQDYFPIYTEIGTLDTLGGSHAENTALKDTYKLRWNPTAAGWYVWKDHSNGTKDVSALALVTGDPTTTGTTTVGTFTDRSNGDSTTDYTPAAATPPVLGALDTAANRTPAHPYMALRSSVVASNSVNYFWVENDFYQDPMLTPFTLNNSVQTAIGELQYSYDKLHWLHAVNTQGASQKKVGTLLWMGSTQKLTRNTWFRWVYKGDLMTAPGSTSARLVKVAPTITVKIAASGGKRTVYGSVLRSRGKIELLRKVGTKYKAVATVAISSKGAYTFGKRVLAKGTYEVVSLADAGWAASAKVFKI
jgi:hypothetical protein